MCHYIRLNTAANKCASHMDLNVNALSPHLYLTHSNLYTERVLKNLWHIRNDISVQYKSGTGSYRTVHALIFMQNDHTDKYLQIKGLPMSYIM